MRKDDIRKKIKEMTNKMKLICPDDTSLCDIQRVRGKGAITAYDKYQYTRTVLQDLIREYKD